MRWHANLKGIYITYDYVAMEDNVLEQTYLIEKNLPLCSLVAKSVKPQKLQWKAKTIIRKDSKLTSTLIKWEFCQ